MRTFRQRIAAVLDPTPERLNYEQLELIVKAARRCAHDLAHAASDVSYSPYDSKERSKFWHERAAMWRQLFYPGCDGKNYRHQLHARIDDLERLNAALLTACETAGFDPFTDKTVKLAYQANDIPF